MQVILYEGGVFTAYSSSKPSLVEVDGKKVSFEYDGQLLMIKLPSFLKKPVVFVEWNWRNYLKNERYKLKEFLLAEKI